MPDGDRRPIVIVGAGHGGTQAAARLVEAGVGIPPVLIDGGVQTPYERPPLSKERLKEDAPERVALLRRETFFADKGIDLRLGQSVVALDRDRHAVELGNGQRLPFSKLILATGARARPLTIPGAQLEGVFTLRTLDDSRTISQALTAGARLVIIGAGYIGMEVAAAGQRRGCEVMVVEAQPRVMSRVTSEPVSRYFEKLHRRNGADFIFNAEVAQIRRRQAGLEVVTRSGTRLDADLVVVGIGVLPKQELAGAAGLKCADGILVDENARTSDPDIYAIGDAARQTQAEHGASLRLECVQNALDMAEAAVRHITGMTPPPRPVPWFWTVQHDTRLQTAGVSHPGDDTIVRGEPDSGRFSVLYVRDGRLAAIDTVNSLRDFTAGKKLIASQLPVDAHAIRDPRIPLADQLSTISSAS